MRNRNRLLPLALSLTLLAGLAAGCTEGAPPATPTPSSAAPVETPAPAPTPTPETGAAATMVLRGGSVYTMDAARSTATAVALNGTEIVYVGDDAGAEAFIGPDTQVMDLNGEMVLPGFTDGHAHPCNGELTELYSLYLYDVEPTIEAYQAALKTFVEANPDLDSILGNGAQLNAFPDNKPVKEAIDAVVSDRPVIIHDTSGHGLWVNSKAIELAGITAETEAPAGGTIYLNDAGEPCGYFSDAGSLFEDVELKYTEEQFETAFRKFQDGCYAKGITSVLSAGTLERYIDVWSVLHRLDQSGELKLRISSALFDTCDDPEGTIAKYQEAQKTMQSDYLTIDTVKIVLDGVVEGGTALLLEPYDSAAGLDPDFKGSPKVEPEQFQDAVTKYDAAGLTVHIHGIADGSVRMALDAYEKAMEENGTLGTARHAITHATIVDPADMNRFGELGVVAAMQPIWFYRDPIFSELERLHLGDERFQQMYHIRDMLDGGAVMTGSSDYPITADNRPLAGIETGVTMCSPYAGQDTNPEYIRGDGSQGATLMEMLETYTINGAYQNHLEDRIGSLEVGKKADLVILEHDLFDIDPTQIENTKILYTIFDGEVVYQG